MKERNFEGASGRNGRPEHHLQNGRPSGHELPLASIIRRQGLIRIETVRGHILVGELAHFDKYSLTLLNYKSFKYDGGDETIDRGAGPLVIFKHAITSFEETR